MSAPYHEATRHCWRDGNGRWLCGPLRTRTPCRRTCDGDRAAQGRHNTPQVAEILHADFKDCSALAEALSGQDAAVFCSGAYTGAVPDAELRTITVDYTIEFARVLRASSPEAAFSFLSGSGADRTGRSRMPFARYKGEAENALHGARFTRVYLFRPAYIYPVEPRKEPTFSYRLLRGAYPAFRVLFPNQVIRADDLARAMLDVVVRETGERGTFIFENRDIRAIAAAPR